MRRVEALFEVAFRTGQRWPYFFRIGEQSFKVRSLLTTRIRESKWWGPGGSERRVYYRVVADPGKAPSLLCVLCHAENGDLPEWSLRAIEDEVGVLAEGLP